MDKVNRSRRIHFLMQYVPELLEPEIGVYFGEHVIRVNGQLCLVVNMAGEVGIRALHPALASELSELCKDRHWVAHGRVYEQWHLLPESVSLNESRVQKWIGQAAEEVYRLSMISAIPNKQSKISSLPTGSGPWCCGQSQRHPSVGPHLNGLLFSTALLGSSPKFPPKRS